MSSGSAPTSATPRQRGGARAFALLALLPALVCSSCLHRMIGAGSVDGFSAEERLAVGMTSESAVRALTDGGTVMQKDVFVDAPDAPLAGRTELGVHAQRLAQFESSTGHDVWSALLITRVWGMFGYDEYALFFDESSFLLGWSFLHLD